ncbi:MAG: PQQ-binding-like beta-propeller repeat protein [Bryobacteraceae bacterium]|nr:PQQ-binding-like beta-propeller repeat protein [Bryobacteraceae bacterium]
MEFFLALFLAWPQWGGPSRDFHAADQALELRFPKGGPRQLWKRELGDGYSAVVTDGGAALYTAFRRGNDNVVVALDSKSGATIWERALAAPPLPNMFLDYGQGPIVTPLLVGQRLFVVTFTGQLAALDRKTGAVAWSRELWKEFAGTFRDVGYANSPIAYGDTILLPIGGKGKGVAAFRQADGKVVWQSTDLENAMSSPIVIRVDGEEHAVFFMVDAVAGVDPKTGRLLWRHPHSTSYHVNASTPVWCPEERMLVISSAYNAGGRGIRLERVGGRIEPKEAWFQRRLRVHHHNLLRRGAHVYGSSGDFGPAPLTAVNVTTGEVAWQSRHFPKASLVQVGSKTLVLDEDGRLALARLSPKGLEVLEEAAVLEKLAWTAPSVVGTRVYARDRKSLVALELEKN